MKKAVFKYLDRKTLIAGVAAVAVAAGLGIAGASGAFSAKPAPEATPASTQEAEAPKPTKKVDAASVRDAMGKLTYAGEDISTTGEVAVEVKDGHVMVTQTVDADADSQVRYAATKSAALARALDGTAVEDTDTTKKDNTVKDVTYVVADADGNTVAAVVNAPDSKAATDAGKQAEVKPAEDYIEPEGENKVDDTKPVEDTSTADPKPTDEVVNGSDGWTIAPNTHDRMTDKDKVAEKGGKEPTTPDGTVIVPDTPAPKVEETKPTEDAPKTEDSGSTAAPSTDNGSSSSNQSSDGSSSSSQSSSSSSTPAPREKRPVYRTERRWVQDRAAWDEQVFDHSYYLCSDGHVCYGQDELANYLDDHDVSYSLKEVWKTIHHDAEGHWEEYQVLDHYE